MRSLFFILVVFTFSATAQTPFIKQTFEKANVSARAGQFETAIENYRKILLSAETEGQNDDFLAQIHFNIGACFYHRKQNEKAAAEFREAIKLSRRTNQKAFYALGMAEAALKNRQSAEIAFRDALKLKKNDGEAWFDLALLYLELKNIKAAETAFQNSIKYKSVSTADAHNNLGVIFALELDFALAETEFRAALD